MGSRVASLPANVEAPRVVSCPALSLSITFLRNLYTLIGIPRDDIHMSYRRGWKASSCTPDGAGKYFRLPWNTFSSL